MRQLGVTSTMTLTCLVCLLVLCGSRAEKEELEDFASLLSDSGLQQEIKKRLSDLSDYPYGNSDSTKGENNIQPDQLVSDPGSGCNYKVEEGKIIRTHDSINNGASYIDSPVDIQNKSQCRSECCKHDECDLAVFKDKGDEHACYLFACGESCLFTNHTGFSTMQKYRKAVQHEKDLENLATDPPSTTSTTASTTTSTTTTTTTPAPTQKKEPASLFSACSHDDDCGGKFTECVSGFCVCGQGYHAQEGFCREECSRFQFECANVGKPLVYPQCIAVYDTCDGITHCQDNSDELKCDSKQVLAGGGGALDTQGYVDRQQQQAWLLQQQQQQQQLLNSGYIPAMLSPQQLYGNGQQQPQNPYGYNQQLQQLPQIPQQQVLIPVQQGQQQAAGQVPLQQGVPPLSNAGVANNGQGLQQGYLGQPANLAHDLATLQQPIPIQQEYQQQQHLQQQPQQPQQAVQQQPQQVQQQVQQQPHQQVSQVAVAPQTAVQPQPPVQVPHHVANSGQKLGRLAGAQAAAAGQKQTVEGIQGQVVPVKPQQPQQLQPQTVNQQQLDQQRLPLQGLPQQEIPQQGGIQQVGRQQGMPQGGGREVDYPSGRGSYSRVDAVSQQRPLQQTQQQGPSQQQLEPSPPVAVHAGHMNRPIPPTDDFRPAATQYPPSSRPSDGAGSAQQVGGYGEVDRTTGRLLSPPQGQDEGHSRQQQQQQKQKPTGQINYSDGGFIVSDSQPSGDNVARDRMAGESPLTGGTAGRQKPSGYDVGQTRTGQGRARLGDLGRGSWPGQAGDAYIKPGQPGAGADSYGGGDRGRPNLAYGGYDTNSYPQSYPGYDQLYAYADPDPAPNTNPHTDYDYQYAAEPSDENLDELAKLLEEVLNDRDKVTGSRGGAEPSRSGGTGAEGDGSFWDYYDSSSNYRPWTGNNQGRPVSRPEVNNLPPDMTKVSSPGGGDFQHAADRPRLNPPSDGGVNNNQYHPAVVRSTQLPATPLPVQEATTKAPSPLTTTKAAVAVATVTVTEQVGTTSLPPSKRKPAISGGVVAGHVADNLLNDAEVERPTKASNRTAVVVLAMGLAVTALLLIFVGCRLRMVKRRLRRGRPLNSNEADYLINGMYL